MKVLSYYLIGIPLFVGLESLTKDFQEMWSDNPFTTIVMCMLLYTLCWGPIGIILFMQWWGANCACDEYISDLKKKVDNERS